MMIDLEKINVTSGSYRRTIKTKPRLYKINLLCDDKNINPRMIVKNYFEFIGLCVEENKRAEVGKTISYFVIGSAGLNLVYNAIGNNDIYNNGYIYIESDRVRDLKKFLITITEQLVELVREKLLHNPTHFGLDGEDKVFWLATKSDSFKEELLFVAEAYANNLLAEIPIYNVDKSDLCAVAFKRYQKFLDDIINYDSKSDFMQYIALKTKYNINKFRKKGCFEQKFSSENLITETYELNIKNVGEFGLQWLLGETLLWGGNDDNCSMVLCWDQAFELFIEIGVNFSFSKAKLVASVLCAFDHFEKYEEAIRWLKNYCSSNTDDYVALYFLGFARFRLGLNRCSWVDPAMNVMIKKFEKNLLSPSEYKFLYNMIKLQAYIIGGDVGPDREYEWRYKRVEEKDAIDSYIDVMIDEQEAEKEKVKKLIKSETKKYLQTDLSNFERALVLFE